MQASNPSEVQLPLPSSCAVLTPALLPCGDSPAWDSSTAQLGQDGNPAQLVGPGRHAATQMVIFKPQTLSSAVISVSPPTHPGTDGHNGPTLAALGLPAQQLALIGEKGPSTHPAPWESQSPGSSHRQDPAAQAVPELVGLGCKGCRNEDISSSSISGCPKTVSLGLAKLPSLLELCRCAAHLDRLG